MIDQLDLHALADGELSKNDEARLRALLEGSETSRLEYERILAFKQFVKARVEPVTSPEAWKQSVARLDELSKARQVERIVGRNSWALCSVLFLCILVGGVTNRGWSGDRVRNEDLVQMAGTLVPMRTPAPQDNVGMDLFLDAMLGQARQSLAADRLNVVSAATGEFNGRRVARLTLRDADGDTGLIVMPGRIEVTGLPARTVGNREVYVTIVGDMNALVWQAGNNTLMLMGSRSVEEMERLVVRICLK